MSSVWLYQPPEQSDEVEWQGVVADDCDWAWRPDPPRERSAFWDFVLLLCIMAFFSVANIFAFLCIVGF